MPNIVKYCEICNGILTILNFKIEVSILSKNEGFHSKFEVCRSCGRMIDSYVKNLPKDMKQISNGVIESNSKIEVSILSKNDGTYYKFEASQINGRKLDSYLMRLLTAGEKRRKGLLISNYSILQTKENTKT